VKPSGKQPLNCLVSDGLLQTKDALPRKRQRRKLKAWPSRRTVRGRTHAIAFFFSFMVSMFRCHKGFLPKRLLAFPQKVMVDPLSAGRAKPEAGGCEAAGVVADIPKSPQF